MTTGMSKTQMKNKRSNEKKSLSKRGGNRVEITSAITSHEKLVGLEVLESKTKRVKFNRRNVIISETENKY